MNGECSGFFYNSFNTTDITNKVTINGVIDCNSAVGLIYNLNSEFYMKDLQFSLSVISSRDVVGIIFMANGSIKISGVSGTLTLTNG